MSVADKVLRSEVLAERDRMLAVRGIALEADAIIEEWTYRAEKAQKRAAEADATIAQLLEALQGLVASHNDFMWCAQQTPPRVPDMKWSEEIQDAALAAIKAAKGEE